MTLRDLLRTGFITKRFAPIRIYGNYETISPIKDYCYSSQYGRWQRRDTYAYDMPNLTKYPDEVLDMEIMDYKKSRKELYLKGTYTPKKLQPLTIKE